MEEKNLIIMNQKFNIFVIINNSLFWLKQMICSYFAIF